MKSSLARLATCALLVGGAAGCASLNFHVRVEPVVFQDTQLLEEKARQLSEADLGDVVVLVGILPDGVARSGSELKVDGSRYELLGSVHALPKSAWFTTLSWWTYDYVPGEGWRRPYCAVQVPLGWVTLGLWGIVPLQYPCAVRETASEEAIAARRARMVDGMKRATRALGGNLLLIERFGGESLYGVTWWNQVLESSNATGVALRVKAPPRLVTPSPSTDL